MKKKDSSTGNNNTYQKEQARHLKRIRSFLKDARERGFIFYDRKVPKSLVFKSDVSEYSAPRTVKQPTAVTVNKLSKITPEYLYQRALWIDPQSGEVMSGVEGRKVEQKRAAQKAAQTRKKNKAESKRPANTIQPPPIRQPFYEIIDRIRGYIDEIQSFTTGWPKMDAIKQSNGRYLYNKFEDALQAADMDGRLYEFSEHLKNHVEEFSNAIETLKRDSSTSTVEADVGSLLTIINQGPLSASDWSDYNDAMEFDSNEERG